MKHSLLAAAGGCSIVGEARSKHFGAPFCRVGVVRPDVSLAPVLAGPGVLVIVVLMMKLLVEDLALVIERAARSRI